MQCSAKRVASPATSAFLRFPLSIDCTNLPGASQTTGFGNSFKFSFDHPILRNTERHGLVGSRPAAFRPSSVVNRLLKSFELVRLRTKLPLRGKLGHSSGALPDDRSICLSGHSEGRRLFVRAIGACDANGSSVGHQLHRKGVVYCPLCRQISFHD